MLRRVLAVATMSAVSLLVFVALARPSGEAGHGGSPGVGPAAALAKLTAGNARFVDGKPSACTASNAKTRAQLATGQKPHTIVRACPDSRVPPELVFDQAMGEIFVLRVAGNVVDPVVLGSMEYAAEHLGSSLIVVLGHERCGAVTATVEANGKAPGNVGAIVKSIAPALKAAQKTCASKDKAGLVECTIDENVRHAMKSVTKESAVLKKLVDGGKLKIVGAKYDLDDGKVTLLEGLK
jgi:carbonic anhydrase